MAQRDEVANSSLLSTPKGFQQLSNIVGIGVFLLTFGVFYSIMAPTVSFWDCGEFIASCYSLGIPHPPGNPLYILIGRVFTMIFFWTEQVAWRVNLISPLTGALTAFFIFKITARALRPMLGEMNAPWKTTTSLVSSIVAALFGVFNITFWFSAVEAEVQTPAMLMVVINVYITLVWSQSKAVNRDKYLLLFAYLAFLGIGIHMMSMFALFPAFLYIVLVDKNKLKDWRLWGVAFLMGSVVYSMGAFVFMAPFLLVITAIYAFLPRKHSSWINAVSPIVFFVLTQKLVILQQGDWAPFVMLEVLTLIELVLFSLNKEREVLRPYAWHLSFGIVLMVVLGYSVHLYIPIRSTLEPMIDENHPVIVFAGTPSAQKMYDAFVERIKTENGPVLSSYSEYVRAIKGDAKLDSLYGNLREAVGYAEYSKSLHEEMLSYQKLVPAADQAYSNYLKTVASNKSVQSYYDRYIAAMGEKKLDWTAFRDFLERKQYGSESMITRAFHRRGAFSRQMGIDGNMGYGGFHLTQFFHFGEDYTVDRKGSGGDGEEARGRNNIISGPLSQSVELKILNKSLSAKDKATIAQRMGLSSFDSISVEEQIYAVKALSSQLKDVKGVAKFISTTKQLSFFKRVGILFLYLLPTFFVLFTWGYWRKQDWRMFTLMATLVLTTTLALVFYMNFADGTRTEGSEYREWQKQRIEALQKGYQEPARPQPVHREVRERDYFYTTGFMFFGMWIGLALAAVLHKMYTSPAGTPRRKFAPFVVALGIASPAIPMVENYHENDRRNDWIPYDYAFNLLMSCEKDGILFTNGDNDTFPLWFLQEAEGIRKDVRIVNLSLVNTKWYIKQLKRLEPIVPISYSEREIEYQVNHQLNPFTQKAPFTLKNAGVTVYPPTQEEMRVLRIQDLMVLNIVDATAWKKPIYFSVTVSPDNLMGLDPYLRQEGMVYRVMPQPVDRADAMNMERTAYLLDQVYRFRNLGDNSLPIGDTGRNLMNNYAAAFIQYNLALRERMLKLKEQVANGGSSVPETTAVVDSSVQSDSTAVVALPVVSSVSAKAEYDSLVAEVLNKYDRCVAIMPWDVRARKYRHDFLMEFEKYDIARTRLNEALKIDPVNGLYRNMERQLDEITAAKGK